MGKKADKIHYSGITPYLFYDDAAAMITWLETVFGFEEIERHLDGDGRVQNAELRVGDNELWIDGYPGYWASRGGAPDQWIGIWVNDTDAMYKRVREAGVDCDPPSDRPHGVRELKVRDPQGYVWGFMQRIVS